MLSKDDKQTELALGFQPPRTLAMAISEIQEYYNVEVIAPLSKNTFTLKHFMAFSRVATHSALVDSILWVVIYVLLGGVFYVIQDSYLIQTTTQLFFWRFHGSPLYFFSKLLSFGGLMYSTVLCVMMSSLYVPNWCKRAIDTILFTRAVMLMSFAFVAFFCFGLINRYVLTQHAIYQLASFFQQRAPNSNFPEHLYHYLYEYGRRSLFESGITVLVASAVSTILPFIAIWGRGFFHPMDAPLSFKN
jgi:hypothetical protein